MTMTHRFSHAFAVATLAHASQVRKGANIPYISHPMAVAAIALEHGADEDQAIAALLHDAIEDGGASYRKVIAQGFGERVLSLVEGCTDGVPDASGVKAPWKQRKEAYVAHMRTAHSDVLLVSGSDKLHNARAIVGDLEVIGTEVFKRFSSSMDETLWYYRSLAAIFVERRAPMAAALQREVSKMHELSRRGLDSASMA